MQSTLSPPLQPMASNALDPTPGAFTAYVRAGAELCVIRGAGLLICWHVNATTATDVLTLPPLPQKRPCPKGDYCPHAHSLYEYW
jgi:hypothetical protein